MAGSLPVGYRSPTYGSALERAREQKIVTRQPQQLTALGQALGRCLAQRCADQGVTQQQVGRRTGYSRSSISHIVAGRQIPGRCFWAAVDSYLDVDDQLLTAYDEYAVVKHRHHEQKITALITGTSLGRTHDGVRDLVRNAAHSSALLDSALNAPGIDPRMLDEARGDLHQLAADYVATSSLPPILEELVILRDRLQTLLERHGQRPDDARELHLLLGATCALLASISHDLAEPHAAVVQTRTAWTFAELAGHKPLTTWVYCTRAMASSWWGTPEEVLHHAHNAHTVGAGHGIAVIRMAGLQARAFAQLGNTDRAIQLLHTADGRRDKLEATDGLHDLGEVFTFPRARQHYYNAATHLHLETGQQPELRQTP